MLKNLVNHLRPKRAPYAVMSMGFLLSTLAATFGMSAPASAVANPCPSNTWYTEVFDQNNNALGLNDDDYGGGHQCANNTNGGANFTVSNAGSVVPFNGKVQAYPNMIYGCDQGSTCFDANFGSPKQVNGIANWYATSTIDHSAVASGSQWDAGYDLWFNRTNSIGPSRGAELFINFNRGNRSEPTTNKKASNVNFGGSNYDIFEFPQTAVINGTSYTWNFVQYWRLNPTNSPSHLNMNQFMTDAINRGYLSGSWYWTGIDSGFELWYNGSGLQWQYNFISP